MLGDAPVTVSMPAVDIERARVFYRDSLGLKERDNPGEGSAIFEAGAGTTIFLYQRAATTADHTAASFLVEDVEATVAGLTEKGVVFEQYDMGDIKTDERGIAELGENKAAWFKDSEGNILSINQM